MSDRPVPKRGQRSKALGTQHPGRGTFPLRPTHRNPEAQRYRDGGHWPQQTLDALFARTVERNSNREIIIDGGRRITFAELDRLAAQAAHGLASLGVGAGDVVASQLPNWWEAVVCFLAALRLGAIVNPLLPIFRESELRFTLRQSGARVLVIPGEFRGCDHRDLIRQVRRDLPALREVVVARSGLAQGMRSFDGLLQAGGQRVPACSGRSVDPDALALLMYTSGTTAAPKGVLHTHNTLGAEIMSLARVHQLGPTDRALMPSPLSHISGVIHGILAPALLGTSAVLMDRWQPEHALELITREQVTYMVGAPAFLQDLLAQPETATAGATCLRLFSCGGAAVSPALIAEARRRFPRCVAKRAYGSTEFPSLTITAAADALARGTDSEGRPIWPAEIRIAHESGASLPAGREGEVQARGPECFVGYADPSLNADAFTPDGWFRTADLGVLDEAGYLRITGRLKDIVIRKGEKISSKELEDLIAAHPAVAEVVVVPVPDVASGERACAVVRLHHGQRLDLRSLTQFLASRGIATQKWPEQIEVVAEFPRTESGKVMRAKVKEMVAGPRET